MQVQERLKLFRRNSEGAGGSLAYQYRNCTRGQVNPRGVCVRGRGEGGRKGEREESEGGREEERRGRVFPYTYPLMHPIPPSYLCFLLHLLTYMCFYSPPLPLPQVCEALRLLELDRSRLKAYIDQLLAVVLEKTPSLLEGMPRIQQGGGMRLELLTMATLPEVGHLTPERILIGQ